MRRCGAQGDRVETAITVVLAVVAAAAAALIERMPVYE